MSIFVTNKQLTPERNSANFVVRVAAPFNRTVIDAVTYTTEKLKKKKRTSTKQTYHSHRLSASQKTCPRERYVPPNRQFPQLRVTLRTSASWKYHHNTCKALKKNKHRGRTASVKGTIEIDLWISCNVAFSDAFNVGYDIVCKLSGRVPCRDKATPAAPVNILNVFTTIITYLLTYPSASRVFVVLVQAPSAA